MYGKVKDYLRGELSKIEEAGLYKHERIIESEQGAEIIVKGKKCLNFCANNYLGLSSHAEVIKAAHEEIDHRGYGLSSVRFICGTQDIHKELERKVAEFLGTEDTILFSSCSMPTGPFSSLCWVLTMPSSPMRSIMLPSSTASGCAKPNGGFITMVTCATWRRWIPPPAKPAKAWNGA